MAWERPREVLDEDAWCRVKDVFEGRLSFRSAANFGCGILKTSKEHAQTKTALRRVLILRADLVTFPDISIVPALAEVVPAHVTV